jgi:hypothetical protein
MGAKRSYLFFHGEGMETMVFLCFDIQGLAAQDGCTA